MGILLYILVTALMDIDIYVLVHDRSKFKAIAMFSTPGTVLHGTK
jgi:hypothetical protein